MELWDLLALARRRIGTIIGWPVIGMLVAAGLFFMTPTSYTANAGAYVSVSVGSADTMATTYSNAATLAEKKATAFVPVFTSTTLAQDVINDLGLDMTPNELASNITADNVTGTVTINVTATANSEQEAIDIADAVIAHAATRIKGLEGETSPVTVVPLSSAALSGVATSPSAVKYLGIGAAGGLLIGLIVAFCASVMDTRIQSLEEASRASGATALGALTVRGAQRNDAVLRRIREVVLYTGGGRVPARTVLVASATGEAGTWKVASELARATALAGQQTVLVDARMSTGEGGSSEAGLAEVLSGSKRLNEAVSPSGVPGLLVMRAGHASDPAAFLASPRMEEALAILSRDRCVIIAGPALHPGAEGLILSRLVERIIMVALFKHTTADQLAQAVEALGSQADQDSGEGHGELSGVILNDAPSSALDRLRYGDFNEAA
ncbi:hypothetical protein [Actinomyces bowdenii]|uniref:Polysaccharide chain length determinant N-terminal domain-containing protein n=1 Tax=Actinomyces bowdenii TaxID=131109 RepID=A0A853ENB2_9ACTO|nr:hypothetical protein [Actinomyces bowdenii]MBF0697609.1 hypothetical protein [Actinomyces bowdenii]NYS69782.1 hypothetical protein [Actinomyces bowdenii]